jgi:hypothetical protein
MSRRLVIGECRLWCSLVMWVERLLFVNWWRGGIRVEIMLMYIRVRACLKHHIMRCTDLEIVEIHPVQSIEYTILLQKKEYSIHLSH